MKAVVVVDDVDPCGARAGGRARCGRRPEGRRSGAKFQAAGERRQDLSAGGFQGQGSGRARVVPEGVHPGLHDRVQVAGGARRPDREVQRQVLHGQRRPARGRQGEHRVCQGARRQQVPAPERSRPRKSANAYGVLNTERGFANRWTFYIDKNGKISAIDKDVTSAGNLRRRHGRHAEAVGRRGEEEVRRQKAEGKGRRRQNVQLQLLPFAAVARLVPPSPPDPASRNSNSSDHNPPP